MTDDELDARMMKLMNEDLTARRGVVEMYREFAAKDPSQRRDLAASLQDLADAAQGYGLWDEAFACSIEAITIYDSLPAKAGDVLFRLAAALLNLGRWLLLAGQLDDGVRVLDEAGRAHHEIIVSLPPENLVMFGGTLIQTAVSLREAGELRACLPVCDWAIEAAQRARAATPDSIIFEASVLTVKGFATYQLGDTANARTLAQQSLTLATENAKFDLDGSIGRTAQDLVNVVNS